MNPDQLFKALPTDLQWEILETFIGTHVVRNGKLMRKMTGPIQSQLLDKVPMVFGMRTIKLYIKHRPIQTTGNMCDPNTRLCIRSFVNMHGSRFRLLSIGENLDTGELFYRYIVDLIEKSDRIEMTTPLANGQVLPPFIKNTYPSYEYTDKKKGVIGKKVVLYNPTKPNTCYRGLYFYSNDNIISI
jgi:hypothetical protein